MTKQDIKQFADLYGYETTIEAIKKLGYTLVSFTEKTIPTGGSMCRKIESLKTSAPVDITSVILHRKIDSITLKTTLGNLRFWK